MMLTLGAVVTGGVLSRFPGLRMAFLEGSCSWLPWWLWALDERWEAWGDHELFGQDALPSELFRRQCFVSVEPEEELAKHVVTEVGNDNLVMSTEDRKSTRLNSSHLVISYAVFCLKKKE